jgi:hypothetical protein
MDSAFRARLCELIAALRFADGSAFSDLLEQVNTSDTRQDYHVENDSA